MRGVNNEYKVYCTKNISNIAAVLILNWNEFIFLTIFNQIFVMLAYFKCLQKNDYSNKQIQPKR